MAAGDALVLGNNADFVTNGGVPVEYAYAGFLLSNNGDEVIVDCGGTQIDQVVYDGNFDTTGAAKELDQVRAELDHARRSSFQARRPIGTPDIEQWLGCLASQRSRPGAAYLSGNAG